MSFREDLADYFERLAIRRVLGRTLGRGGHGELYALGCVFDPVIVPRGVDAAVYLAAELRRRSHIRREVEALCAQISASPDRKTR